MKVSCPRCGKENTDDVRFCLGCGAELQPRGAGGRSAGPPKINAPPPLGMARPAGPPLGAPVAAAPAGPPGIGGPPPLAPPVAAPAPTAGPPLFGPLPPIGAPAGGGPPSIGLAGAPAGLGALPPLNAVGAVAPAGPVGPPPIAPPSLGALPPVGARPAAPAGPPPAASGLGLGALPPLGGVPSPAAPTGPSGLGLGPLPPVGAPVAPPPSPGLGLGPLPPIAAPPAAVPAFSAPAVGNVAPPQPAALGGLPPLAPQPQAPSGLGGLPPLAPQPQAPSGLGGLPPLAPQSPASTRLPTGTGAAYGASTGNDPFGNSSDPFASNGDPFAVSSGGAAAPPPYNAPSDMYLAAADPYAAQAQRPRTIGPGGAMPVPPVAPAARAQFGQTSMPQGGDPWGAPRIEPEIEDSRTHVGPAVGRPKLLITQLDGTEEGEFPLKEGENVIGREASPLLAKDNLLSGRHATFIVQGSSVWIRDDGSRNGVYVRLPRQQHVELSNGDQFCIGRIILRFELQPAADSVGLLHLVVGRDVDKAQFPVRVPMGGLTLGRNRADLKFPTDGWVSGLHCQIVVHGPQVLIVDLGSSNGTYHRIRAARPLVHHDAVLMGQRIFHLHCP